MVLFYTFATWIPIGGVPRLALLVALHGLLLAWLTDIDWQEGVLLGIFNILMFSMAA